MKLTDQDPFPFGKYKDEPMEDVPASYLDWFIGQSWADNWPAVVDYIKDNRVMIDKELRNSGALDD